MGFQRGQNLSHYRLVERIGEGGMGVVWKAEDTILDRTVAIKVLARDLALDEEHRRLFLDEARLAASVSHGNIVQVHELGREDDLDFIVMEYIEGQPLSKYSHGKRLAPEKVVALGLQVAEGLARAHRRGLIHRDLKPANILVTTDGEAKIVDFGLAMLFSESESTATLESVLSNSNTNASIAGTLPYMSPEQLRGEKLDARSDIFSFGSVLYEAVTGVRPFLGVSPSEVAASVVNGQCVPLHDHVKSVPVELDRIVGKCLAIHPDDRYQTTGDLAVDLRHLIRALERGTAPSYAGVSVAAGMNRQQAGSQRLRRRRELTIGIPLVLLGVLFFVLMVRAPWRAGEQDSSGLVGNLRQLTFSGSVFVPLWSPTGKEISYLDRGSAFLVPAQGGASRRLASGTRWRWVNGWNWLPDGSGLIAHGRDAGTNRVHVIQLGLYGEQTKVLVEDANYGDVSPDGRLIAYHSTLDDDVYVLEMATGKRQSVIETPEPGTAAYKPQWSNDGKRLAVIRWNGFGNELWVVSWPERQLRKVNVGPMELGGHYDWTGDDRAVLTGASLSGIWSVWRIPVDGGAVRKLTAGSENECDASIAPDQRSFAFARERVSARIQLFDAESGLVGQPAELTVSCYNPVFLAGDSTLCFQALVNGRWQLWSVDASGKKTPQAIIDDASICAFGPSVREDGSLLYLQSTLLTNGVWGRVLWSQTLWTAASDGGQRRPGPPAGDKVVRLAPTPERSGRLLISTFGSSGEQILGILEQQGAMQAVWQDSIQTEIIGFDWGTQDGHVLLCLFRSGSGASAYHVTELDPTTGASRSILSTLDGGSPADSLYSLGAIALAPDRQRLAILAMGGSEYRWRLVIVDLGGQRARMLHEFAPEEGWPTTVSWSHDGKRLAVDVRRSDAAAFVVEQLPSNVLVSR